MLSCPPSGAVITSASLLAATGQELTASASVQKNCQQLDVRLVEVGEPVVARSVVGCCWVVVGGVLVAACNKHVRARRCNVAVLHSAQLLADI